MKRIKWLGLIIVIILISITVVPVFAQTYLFQVSREDVTLTINTDGTADLDYLWVFVNDPGASPIDFIDVGLPNSNYDLGSVTADVNGQNISDISSITNGITLGLRQSRHPARTVRNSESTCPWNNRDAVYNHASKSK